MSDVAFYFRFAAFCGAKPKTPGDVAFESAYFQAELCSDLLEFQVLRFGQGRKSRPVKNEPNLIFTRYLLAPFGVKLACEEGNGGGCAGASDAGG